MKKPLVLIIIVVVGMLGYLTLYSQIGGNLEHAATGPTHGGYGAPAASGGGYGAPAAPGSGGYGAPAAPGSGGYGSP